MVERYTDACKDLKVGEFFFLLTALHWFQRNIFILLCMITSIFVWRPKLTWMKLTEKDCREWKLRTVDLQERSTWRSGVRSAMRAASQLPGREPTDVDDAPSPAC